MFVTFYAEATHAIRQDMARGAYLDNAFVSELLVRFANYYRRPLVLERSGRRSCAPAVWRNAYRASRDPLVGAPRTLILGILAHVRDLGFALADIEGPLGPRRKQDYGTIGNAVASCIDRATQRVAQDYAPGIATLDALLLRFDERALIHWLEVIRADAWNFACDYKRAHTRSQRRSLTAAYEQRFLARSYFIWGPTALFPSQR